MLPVRIFLPDDCSVHHPALRAWRVAIDKANADLAAAMNWRLNVNFTDMTFHPIPVATHSNVVSLPSFRRARQFLHPIIGPQGDGPRAA